MRIFSYHPSIKKYTHRRDAKNAENFLKKKTISYLCVLCVSAVKTVFMDEH